MKIQSTLEFIQWKFNNPDYDLDYEAPTQMFRGQLDASWELLPGIVRYADKYSQGYTAVYNSIADLEVHLIERFQKYSIPFKDFRPVSFIEKLVHGQHYGLPTRLLDWTTNPLKALYFSVENPDFDSVDGMVYEFIPTGWLDETKLVALDSSLVSFLPELIDSRLNAQEGCFTSFPLPETGFTVLPLSKANYPQMVATLLSVEIDAASKREIRFELNELGINRRTLFPGLEGVAKWVKSDLSSFMS